MNKRSFILAAGFVLALAFGSAFAQDEQKIAVYVKGSIESDEKKALGTKMLSSLVKSRKYTAIERPDVFFTESQELAQGHAQAPAMGEEAPQAHEAGSAEESQVLALAKQFGAQFVCILDVAPAFKSYHVAGRIVDIETANVIAKGEASNNMRKKNAVDKVSDKVMADMLDLEIVTGGKRFWAWTLNTPLPGLGSELILNDRAGALTQSSLLLLGGLTLFVPDLLIDDDHKDPSRIRLGTKVTALYLGANIILYNAFRTFWYYDGMGNASDNFTDTERTAAFVANIFAPGLGSSAIMGDPTGTLVMMALGIPGLIMTLPIPGIGGWTKEEHYCNTTNKWDGTKNVRVKDCSYGYEPDGFFVVGAISLATSIVFNLVRTATYDKDTKKKSIKNIADRNYGSVNFAVLPNEKGKLLPYLMYNLSF